MSKIMENFPVGGIILMIKNEDESFTPIGMDSNQTQLFSMALQAVSNCGDSFVRLDDKYVRQQEDELLKAREKGI